MWFNSADYILLLLALKVSPNFDTSRHRGAWKLKEGPDKASKRWDWMERGVEGGRGRAGGKKAEYGPQGSFPQRRVTLGLWINAVCAAVPYRGTDNTERDQEGICFNTSFFNSFLCSSQSTSTPPPPSPAMRCWLSGGSARTSSQLSLSFSVNQVGCVWCNISLESYRSGWHREQNGLNLIWLSKTKLWSKRLASCVTRGH